MPVARIITTSPAASEELRRQLTAAGYSVKFTAPDEEFSDADIVVAAANVHSDYALQYAAEVAAEAGADVIVAPGVVAGSAAQRTDPAAEPGALASEPTQYAEPVALASGRGHLPAGTSIRESLGEYGSRIGGFLEQLKHKRELAAERKRLEHEQREIERAEQRRIFQQQRMEMDARLAAEREQLRAQRQAEQERIRLEQAEMRRAIEEERARIAIEQERARAAERERIAQAPAPPLVVAAVDPVPPPVITPTAPVRPAATSVHRTVRQSHRPAPRRAPNRDRRFQKAALVASIAALVAMVGFAVAMNIHPGSPMPHSMVQNPVQEKSPFGAASITPATTTNPVPAKPATRAVLPQRDAAPAKPPAAKATKPSPTRTRRAARDNYVAEDEVIVHHYGQTAQQKHPPAAQTQAGVRKYTDQD